MTSLVISVAIVTGLCGVVAVLVGLSLFVEQYYSGEERLLRLRGYIRYVENCTKLGIPATPPKVFWK